MGSRVYNSTAKGTLLLHTRQNEKPLRCVVPSVVAEASIGVAASDAIFFCRLDGGVEEGMLNYCLVLEIRTRLFGLIIVARVKVIDNLDLCAMGEAKLVFGLPNSITVISQYFFEKKPRRHGF